MKSELAKARDKWLDSVEGRKCCMGQAKGQYLCNRLRRAFIAGWDACGKTCKQALKGHTISERNHNGKKEGINERGSGEN